jgi:PST family polysaccharide transporter
MFDRLKTASLKALFWSSGESLGVAVLSLAVFVALARILEPADFGVMAIAAAFVAFFNLFVTTGMADALVQRDEIGDGHRDTVFWTMLGAAVAAAALLHLAAWPVARWYGKPMIAELLPVIAWTLPLTAAGTVQMALFRREMRFRAAAACSLTGRAAGAAVGVAMALSGAGVWSLAGQQAAGALVSSVAAVLLCEWRPRFRFSMPCLRALWRYGLSVSATTVISGFGEQALTLVVGMVVGAGPLGYFSVAWRTTQLLRSVISAGLYYVGLSAFSRLQRDRAALARAFLQATRLSCLFGFPVAAGMALLATPLVTVMYGAKWAASGPLLAILSLQMFPAFYAMFLTSCYRALDKAHWVLVMATVSVAGSLGAAVACAPLGVGAMAASWSLLPVLLLPVHVALMARLLPVTARQLLGPLPAPALATLAMAAVMMLLMQALGDTLGAPGCLVAVSLAGAAVYGATVLVVAPGLLRTASQAVRVMLRPSAS